MVLGILGLALGSPNRRAIAGFVLGCVQFVLLFFGYGVLW